MVMKPSKIQRRNKIKTKRDHKIYFGKPDYRALYFVSCSNTMHESKRGSGLAAFKGVPWLQRFEFIEKKRKSKLLLRIVIF